MYWIISTAMFVIGIFIGLCLFAMLEFSLINKLLILKAEILYSVKEEFKLFKKEITFKKKRK